MQALIALLFIPIMILNFAGGIVGGVWLGIEGEWRTLGIGIAALFGGTFVVSLLMLPGLGLIALSVPLLDRGRTILAMPLMMISTAWTYVVMGAWCLGSFYLIVRGYDHGSIWPFLLWSYSTAVGPWLYMASKEHGEATGSMIAASSACFASLAMMGVILLIPNVATIDVVIACGICLAIGFLLQAVLGIAIAVTEHRMRVGLAKHGPEGSSW